MFVIEELCLAGACHRGISYIGAVTRLEELGLLKRDKLKKVVGVSIGSFLAFCYICNYGMAQLFVDVVNEDISKFNDICITENSVLAGKVFRDWVLRCVSKMVDPNITMAEFYAKYKVDFTIVATCLQDGVHYISHKKYPNFKVYDALIASMNVPFVFPPYEIDGKSYIDGGMIDNFPMHLLGVDAVGLRSAMGGSSKGFLSQINQIVTLITKHTSNLNKSNTGHVIVLDSDNKFLDFNIDADDKLTLYMMGIQSVNKSPAVSLMLLKDKYKSVMEELIGSVEPTV